MNDLATLKKAARREALARRRDAHVATNTNALGHLSEILAGYHGIPLAGYIPIRTEINPLPAMIEAVAHGPVGVPVIQGDGKPLLFSRWAPDCSLKEGRFGALIPVDEVFFEPEILIVPLVAFDRKGTRLGYGGGYYDRTLMQLRNKRATLAIGFAYSAQEILELPIESTDQKLDVVVTESGIVDIG
ncbi:MAG: 5-formyltetrahydrofolate cyclo-ligase [Roseovarius sp.]|nr:5-formyltetrahydrofolate cyclo-ligase [Roseovarius sp.]MCY4209335.1 5-formyltetrahydrofolate cyclo-ligase [Roseovarius sp.]MCY4291108.1 5-formyltetrahydrofolate cyclo-ligase [Roseovarius sp.]MCY4316588.1 5-formyltetrahydrofolate cyclo-ligase [Roseovarius sp.]